MHQVLFLEPQNKLREMGNCTTKYPQKGQLSNCPENPSSEQWLANSAPNMSFSLYPNPSFEIHPVLPFSNTLLNWKADLALRNQHVLLTEFLKRNSTVKHFLFFNWVSHLVQSIHLSLPSIKEFANGLYFSRTHFHGMHLQLRSFCTDGRFPAFSFRLLIMKNAEIFPKYYMNLSLNLKPEIAAFSR